MIHHKINKKIIIGVYILNSPHGLHRDWFEDVLTATDAYAEATLEKKNTIRSIPPQKRLADSPITIESYSGIGENS